MVLETVRQFISQTGEFNLELLYIVGVSGGPDSLALLDILHRLGVHVMVGHFNHGLRDNSADDEIFVKNFGAQLGVSVDIGRRDARTFADTNHLSIEEAGRVLRYQYLFALANENNAGGVIVGHHADDQVETILMHFLRGAGLAGLSGMKPVTVNPSWDPNIPLFRPLLKVSRDSIDRYCNARALKPLEDPTNRDTKLFRNRLRHELVPLLETYNPQVKNVLSRMSDVLGEENELLSILVEDSWNACLYADTSKFIGLKKSCFLALPVGVQRRVLLRAVSLLRPGLRDVGFEGIERGRRGAAEDVGAVPLIGGLHLFTEHKYFWITESEDDLPVDSWPQMGDQDSLQVAVPGRLAIGSDWLLETGWEEAPLERLRVFKVGEKNPFQVVIDPLKLDAPLRMRVRQKGDRLTPLGMRGSIKVADLMANEKIPRRLRALWPLLVAGDDIVWVGGIRLADKFRVTEKTREVLRIELLRK